MTEKIETLQHFTLTAIAEMICGDGTPGKDNKPYACFPYRSSSRLTSFFRDDLGLPYCHNGSTRRDWVLEILKKENEKNHCANEILSGSVLQILEKIFDIKYFIDNDRYEHSFLEEKKTREQVLRQYDNAIKKANADLKHSEIEIVKEDSSTEIQIKSLNKVLIFTSPRALNSNKKFEFSPVHFDISGEIENDLVAIMMPFKQEFDEVYKAIQGACKQCTLRCKRADDIWEKSVIIDDIANLIFRSQIIIVDFSEKNTNVMYETGIAHAWGKVVIPISQSLDHVPFDLSHHRTLKYFSNTEGLRNLQQELRKKLDNTVDKIRNRN